MLSRSLALVFVCVWAGCARSIAPTIPDLTFSSTNDATMHDCPLRLIDSLVPCRVPLARGLPELERIAATNSKLSARGDTLTFAVIAPGAATVRISGGVELPLTRLPNSEIFAASIRVPRAAEALLSYRVFTDLTRGLPLRFEYRGEQAAARPPRAQKLLGRIRIDTLASSELQERREIISYVPPITDAQMRYPVVYLPDGGLVKQIAPILDTLITTGQLRPVVLVGVRAAPGALRARDYVLGFDEDSARFRAHERFFVNDVVNWAEKNLPITTDRAGRILWGASNGGALVIALGLRHPDRFARVLASSPVFEKVPTPERGVSLPVFQIAAGTFEGTSRDRAFGLIQVLRDLNAEATFHELVAGHDELVWIEWLTSLLVRLPSQHVEP